MITKQTKIVILTSSDTFPNSHVAINVSQTSFLSQTKQTSVNRNEERVVAVESKVVSKAQNIYRANDKFSRISRHFFGEKLRIVQIFNFQSIKRRYLCLGAKIMEDFQFLSCRYSTEQERTTHHVRAEIFDLVVMTSRTCADVIQPCPFVTDGSFGSGFLSGLLPQGSPAVVFFDRRPPGF